jgi:phage gpG-like protein
MSLSLTIEVKGVKEIDKRLLDIKSTIKDLRPVFGGTEKVLRNEWKENFEKEGSYKSKWEGLSVRTQADRKNKGYSPAHPILRRSGGLLSGVIGKNSTTVKRIDKDSAEFGVRGAKGFYSDKVREFITLSVQSKDKIVKIVVDALRKAAG